MERALSIAGIIMIGQALVASVAGFAQAADQAQTNDARAMTMKLGKAMKAQLQSAMKAGGPTQALGVCNLIAPTITKDVSTSHDGDVGRTALKVRNPENAPDDFEMKTLLRFSRAAEAGEALSGLEYSEVVTSKGKRTFRYMRAIPMAEQPCAICHGTNIDPDLRQKIKSLYPDDQAVGFQAGDLRGAFTVIKALD